MIEQYRSFEDIPASQYLLKSRRTSSDIDSAFFRRSLALSVLSNSYRGIDMGSGSICPQIKKLQKTYSFTNSFDDFKVSGKNEEYEQKNMEREDEVKKPFYRSISLESGNNKSSDDGEGETANVPRQRRIGMARNLSFQGIKNVDEDLRRKVLTKQNSCNFDNYENIISKDRLPRRTTDNRAEFTPMSLIRRGGSLNNMESTSNLRKLNRMISLHHPLEYQRSVPTIIISNVDNDISEAKNEEEINASTLVELSRNCDCRICSEEKKEDRKSLLSRLLNRLFLKVVSCREYGRKLTYWDENNNVSEGEMYNCFIHVLKLMLGLWLRHLDHN
ncbi:uncharacterized protein ACR2FA_001890 [Aphomia sociella]